MDLCKSANAEFGASSSICFYAVHSWPLKSVFMYQMLICGFCFFQEDNGMPVHLKGGTTDALLYRATMALTVFGKL